MYNVFRQNHVTYGNVVEIIRAENGTYKTPGSAFNKADIMRRLWRDEGSTKVRILVDDKIMSPAQAESWSNEEYKSLPKCYTCNQILNGSVHTHRLCGNHLFCSRTCSDKDYLAEVEKIKDEEEIDYL